MNRAALVLVLAAGLSPFTRPDPGVDAANARLEAGDPAEALRRYDEAERRLGSRAELDLDRGAALYRLGRYPEARDAFARALTNPKGDRPGRARYDLGDALAAAGDVDGAVRELTRALAEDPGDEAARHNLEVLLRRRQEGRPDAARAKAPKPGGAGERAAPPKPGAPAHPGSGGPAPAPTGPGGAGAAAGAGAGAPPPPRGAPPGAAPPGRPGPARPAPAAPPAGAPQPAPGGAGAQPAEEGAPRPGGAIGGGGDRRAEANRLLDALRSREKNLPMWPAREGPERRRGDAAQDW